MDISLILKIAGIGMLVSVASQILSKSGRDEQAMLVTIAGIIAGHGQGTFSDIKVVNATVSGGGRLGGLIGLAQGSVTLSNCLFDGTVTCTGNQQENR